LAAIIYSGVYVIPVIFMLVAQWMHLSAIRREVITEMGPFNPFFPMYNRRTGMPLYPMGYGPMMGPMG